MIADIIAVLAFIIMLGSLFLGGLTSIQAMMFGIGLILLALFIRVGANARTPRS